jgi:glycosyltransferase involved in cell wall biosynthesis
MKKITFCIPSKNNLRYLKNSIQSIKENSLYQNEIIVYIDADNDGTKEWLDKNNIKYLINDTNIPKGIAYGYNRCIEAAETLIVCMFHADMYMAKGFDEAILKYIKPKTVVGVTRIEPPLHPKGLEKIVEDFGMYPEDFLKSEFDKFVSKIILEFKNKTTKGIFAPWAIYKEDIISIGLHDERLHSYHEDSDIFNRFILNEYEIVQTWEGYVYHLTCRGGQFQDGIDHVTTDKLFHEMKNRSFKNYIRKWGSFIKNNEYQYPIIAHKYDIGIHIKNCTKEVLSVIEPWVSNLFVDLKNEDLKSFIDEESKNSIIDLNLKINNPIKNNVELYVDANKLSGSNINFIFNLSEILDGNSLEVGEYEFDVFKFIVNDIKYMEKDLIIMNN